jgi:adenylosuccinate synthase
MIPRSPKLAWFLDDTQRELATARVEEELRHNKHESVDRVQLKRGLTSPLTWMCGLGFFLVNVTVQSFSLFLVYPLRPARLP